MGFMRTDLNLSGNELLVYAIIYGFSQDGNSKFNGSQNYIAEFIGASRNTAIKAIKGLEEKGLIEIFEKNYNGVKLLSYKAVKKRLTPCAETEQPCSISTQPCAETAHNINQYNNKDINKQEESKDSLVGESEDLFGNPKQPKKEKEKNSAKKEKAPEFTTFHFRQSLLELGANEEHLDDWLKVRKQKKAVNSRTALNGFITECTKSGTEIKDAVETCAKNSWSGFKSSWIQSDKKEDNKGESTFIF